MTELVKIRCADGRESEHKLSDRLFGIAQSTSLASNIASQYRVGDYLAIACEPFCERPSNVTLVMIVAMELLARHTEPANGELEAVT